MTKTNITNKQKEILLLLYKFRFLNRFHIQTLLHHKTPITINNWLKDLTEKKYTKKIFKRSWTENTLPTKYYISINGIRFLSTQSQCYFEYLKKLYREKDRSQNFINRCLFIAEVYLLFLTQLENKNKPYEFYTQSNYKPESLIRELSPDFVILEKKNYYYLYQIFYDNTPRYAIRNKIKMYINFFEDQGKDLKASVTYICPEKTFAFTQKFIDTLQEDNETDFEMFVTSRDKLINEELLIKKPQAKD